jgi:hypothetical protein
MSKATEDANRAVEYLRDPELGLWDEKTEEPAPIPEKPTVAQLREAIMDVRCNAGEMGAELLRLIEKQQQQIDWLDRALKSHRHQLETGTFSAKPEF